MKNTQCYAFDKQAGGCCITTYKFCREGCAFFNTPEHAQAAREAANVRLRSLPDEQQGLIADKYYNGKTLWEDMAEK